VLAGAASGQPICALLYTVYLAESGHRLRSRAWCDFATYARAKSRSGLRKPGYAGKNERDRVASVRAGSSHVLSATAVRAGPSCASTSGGGRACDCVHDTLLLLFSKQKRDQQAQAQGFGG